MGEAEEFVAQGKPCLEEDLTWRDLRVGDAVLLCSGSGPYMTVTGRHEDVATCSWFEESEDGWKLYGAEIPNDALLFVPRDRSPARKRLMADNPLVSYTVDSLGGYTSHVRLDVPVDVPDVKCDPLGRPLSSIGGVLM